MSKLFFDQLIVFESLEADLNSFSQSLEEKEELWNLIDELVENRILGCIFDNLPEDFHRDFIDMMRTCPFDDGILDFLSKKGKLDFEELIKNEIKQLEKEIRKDMKLGSGI